MRRADRLFQIVQILRRRRLTTARHLAECLAISERTVYRDIRDLSASGVPIEGEAGVGYRLRGFDLPPLMFTREEVEALVLGARIVQAWTDPELARAAAEALAKIEGALPRDRSHFVRGTPLFAPADHWREEVTTDFFSRLREAIRDSRKVHFRYTDAGGTTSERTVRPSAFPSMARSGSWRPGASCGRIFARSAWTGCATWRCSRTASPPSRGALSRTSSRP